MSRATVSESPQPYADAALSDDDLDRVFMALSNRTRRKMLSLLGSGPATVSDLADPFDMSLPGASKHVRVLEHAGLVRREIDGRVHRCSLELEPLDEADRWLSENRRFWQQQLASLASHFNERDSAEPEIEDGVR